MAARSTVNQQYERCAMQVHIIAVVISFTLETCAWHQNCPPVFFCHSGVGLCSFGLGCCLRKDICPEKTRRSSASMLSWVKFICPFEVYRFENCACILVSTLPFCPCGMFSKILHCVYLAVRGKNVRASRWFRQARQPLLTACGRMAKSRPSRRFAERAMEQWVLHFQGTIAFCLHTLRKTVLFFFLLFVLLVCPCGRLLDVFRLLGLRLRPSSPRCCCHRDSLTRWHLRRKPRVLLLLHLPISSFEPRCALRVLTDCEEFLFKGCGRMRSCFLRDFVFHTSCYLSAASLTVVDHIIEIRLEALKHDYLLVLRM